jgi:hypothetical protein
MQSWILQMHEEVMKKNLYVILNLANYTGQNCWLAEYDYPRKFKYYNIIIHCKYDNLEIEKKRELLGLQIYSLNRILDMRRYPANNYPGHDKISDFIEKRKCELEKIITNEMNTRRIIKNNKKRKRKLIEYYENKLQQIIKQNDNRIIKQKYNDIIKQNNINQMSKQNDNNQMSKQNDNNQILCVICMVDQKKILFLPCKHICSCKKCSEQMNECCICRQQIKEKIEIYI